MAEERKRLLIVDDTEIDRIILKSILASEFEIMEANSGNLAFEYITERKDLLDAILLDISMPHINGFDVLQFMKDKGLDDIPVFLVTAEPTLENVQRAMQYNVEEFIGKPFDKDDILRRLHSRLGVLPTFAVHKLQFTETQKYITDLKVLYQNYLANAGKTDGHCQIMSDLMEILLGAYTRSSRGANLTRENIQLICQAAYFCDIGEMMVPDKRLQALSGRAENKELQKRHTEYGAALVRLNRSADCAYFVDVCSSMCLHHHERWDGTGYPHRTKGKNNSIYNQLCHLVDELDTRRSRLYGNSAKPISSIIRRMLSDNDEMVSPDVYSLLEDSEKQIFDYFMKREAQS
ncbi:MAG: response regulator [Oscillospiraceae bacterium]|nr:response regulator [Oscillospiraceae bacterium]